MADWFFDPTAEGTNSGSSAADAFINPNSWFALQNSAGGLNFGDRVWFRRTSQACMTPSSAFWGKSGWNSSQMVGWFIGWPNSGQPFYDSRPGDARSAGWDADVNTYVNTDINMAVWVHNGDVHPSTPKEGWGVANICILQNSGFSSRLRTNSCFEIPKRNVHLLNVSSTQLNNFHDVTITNSGNVILGSTINGGRLTISASTVVNTAIFPSDVSFTIEELIIQSNSVANLISNNINNNTSGSRAEIMSLRGTKPANDMPTTNNRWTSVPLVVYDYFGEGPKVIIGGGWSSNHIIPASASAQVNSRVVMNAIEVKSQTGTNYRESPARFYGDNALGAPADARFLANVTSGIPYVIRWPLLTTGAMVIDPANHGALPYISVNGPGGRTIYISSLSAGAISSWSGNSVSAGSAWIAKFSWTPTATGSHFINLMIPKRSGVSGMAYIGFPLVSSS